MCDCERAAGVERQGRGWGRGGETPTGPALRCRWAGPAAGPAALAALGSRPRRAPRAGLGLRGGAGTGSGKRQCSGGGGGALPLREPSAGRRAGAAVSRERGPRSPHGRRKGESLERPVAGCNLRRRDAPAAEPPRPHPGLGPRVPSLLASGRDPAPRLRTAPRSCLPGSHSFPKPARCSLLAPAPAPRSLLRPTTPALAPHSSDATFCPGRTLGCAPGCAFPPAGGEWPTLPGHPGGRTGPAGGGRVALRSLGIGRAPRFPPYRGARPGNRQCPEPPALGQKPAQSRPVFAPRLQN